MKQLLSHLTNIPSIIGYILGGLLIISVIIFAIAIKKSDDYYSDENPYLISSISCFIIMTVIILGASFRMSYINERARDYVSVQKENESIVINSHSMFVENKTLPIKQQFSETIIVEYNNVDYVLYEYQLK